MISEIIFRMKGTVIYDQNLNGHVVYHLISEREFFPMAVTVTDPSATGKTHLSSMAPLYSLSRDGYSGGLQVLSYRNHILLTDAYTIRVEVAKKDSRLLPFSLPKRCLNSPEFECLLNHGGNCRVCVLAG